MAGGKVEESDALREVIERGFGQRDLSAADRFADTTIRAHVRRSVALVAALAVASLSLVACGKSGGTPSAASSSTASSSTASSSTAPATASSSAPTGGPSSKACPTAESVSQVMGEAMVVDT